MERISTALLAAAFAFTAPTALHAEPDTPSADRATARDRDSFNELYQDRLREARRTRASDDDLSLLDEMLVFAQQIPDDPGVRGLIYVEAIALAASGGDVRTMLEVGELLEAHWPGHPSASADHLIDQAERVYRGVSRSDRPEVGRPYLDLLLRTARDHAEQEDYKMATAHCRQAHTLARAIDSPHEEHIQDLLTYYAAQNSISIRIERLTQTVQANPKNYPAARELVDLLLVKRDDPAAANAFAPHTDDADMAELIALSAKGVDQATAAQAVRVGDWYVKLSEDQQDEYAIRLLAHARDWYARFLETYPRQDTLASRVRSMDQVAAGRIERIREAGVVTDPVAVVNTGWIELTGKDFDAKQHVQGPAENASVRDGAVHLTFASLAIPFTPADAFEVRLTVTCNDPAPPGPGFLMLIPTSTTFKNRTLAVRYFPQGRTIARLEDVGGERLLEERPPRGEGPRVLTYQVATQDNGEIAFILLVDEIAAVKWQGPAAELNFDPERGAEEKFGTALLTRGLSDITIHKVEYRER